MRDWARDHPILLQDAQFDQTLGCTKPGFLRSIDLVAKYCGIQVDLNYRNVFCYVKVVDC